MTPPTAVTVIVPSVTIQSVKSVFVVEQLNALGSEIVIAQLDKQLLSS